MEKQYISRSNNHYDIKDQEGNLHRVTGDVVIVGDFVVIGGYHTFFRPIYVRKG